MGPFFLTGCTKHHKARCEWRDTWLDMLDMVSVASVACIDPWISPKKLLRPQFCVTHMTCRLGMACHPSTFLGCQLPGFAVHRAWHRQCKTQSSLQLVTTCHNMLELLETPECHGMPKNMSIYDICHYMPMSICGTSIAWAENKARSLRTWPSSQPGVGLEVFLATGLDCWIVRTSWICLIC